MKYHFKVHKEGRDYWAECIELKGCLTQGSNKKELFVNMKEALNLYLEEPESSNFLASFPNEKIRKSKNIIEVPVDPEIAFAFLVRYHRIKNNLTQKEAANKLGMKNLYSYQRLEKKCNASLEIMAKIKNLFPHISFDLAFS